MGDQGASEQSLLVVNRNVNLDRLQGQIDLFPFLRKCRKENGSLLGPLPLEPFTQNILWAALNLSEKDASISPAKGSEDWFLNPQSVEALLLLGCLERVYVLSKALEVQKNSTTDDTDSIAIQLMQTLRFIYDITQDKDDGGNEGEVLWKIAVKAKNKIARTQKALNNLDLSLGTMLADERVRLRGKAVLNGLSLNYLDTEPIIRVFDGCEDHLRFWALTIVRYYDACADGLYKQTHKLLNTATATCDKTTYKKNPYTDIFSPEPDEVIKFIHHVNDSGVIVAFSGKPEIEVVSNCLVDNMPEVMTCPHSGIGDKIYNAVSQWGIWIDNIYYILS